MREFLYFPPWLVVSVVHLMKARGGDPSLDETRPPDVSSQLPFLSPKTPPPEDKKQ